MAFRPFIFNVTCDVIRFKCCFFSICLIPSLFPSSYSPTLLWINYFVQFCFMSFVGLSAITLFFCYFICYFRVFKYIYLGYHSPLSSDFMPLHIQCKNLEIVYFYFSPASLFCHCYHTFNL